MSKHRLEQVSQQPLVGLTIYPCYFEIDGSSEVTSGSIRGKYWTIEYSGANGIYDVTLDDVYWKFLGYSGFVIGDTDNDLKLVAEPTVGATSTTFQVVTQTAGTHAALTSKKVGFELVVISSISGSAV